tara:strand:- start:1557 stop:1886 length:330 start_codon:yes stop_codon:yes gene_type:complete
MKPKPIHTKIIDSRTINDIVIIQENPDKYPRGKSNIYAKDLNGNIKWYAELPVTSDIYPNPIQWDLNIKNSNRAKYFNSDKTFVVSSWNCYTVSIDYKTGFIVEKVFTK